MEKQIIKTGNAPAAIGPYSQGVKIGNLVYTSGQLPIDPSTGELVNDDVKKAAEASLNNVKAILEEAGTSLDKVIKTLVFVKDMNDFAAINEVYSKFFTENYPARSCVQVAKLPKDALVEIEAIAIVE
ncbi:2-iminobutanoate/2-iminopropanoate deaminase [Clostridium tepidiprofundi DSM 19306]|uniref:2-iminobutanoate/2-iminopropanoate deaminase n=1 Tax=Clostridium tepidiprofundi DSM 19306 TaxID=1121338 RepID=A0A151B3J9_9CLOT|nr:RidA family protein [Clostridium tepidiprofundi]KYH34498.1 2-iminobutanoate/2-iminopropanoate deaminase [Clostridium tepidiprofundi DSM 19306]